MTDGKRRVLRYAVLFLSVVVILEAVTYVFGKYYLLRSPASFLLFDPTVTLSADYVESYFSRRDPVLGWPPVDWKGSRRYDRTGARHSPAFPEPGSACVSLYGDSFTYGTDVAHQHAWGNVLAKLLGCRVANYGVPGYGPDQSYLRFKWNGNDEASVVILGFATCDILRVVNQDRRLLSDQYGGPKLKPRFILTEGNELVHIPIPDIGPGQVDDYLRHPQKYLCHEWFLPNSKDGGVVFRFPFTISMGWALLRPRAVNFLASRPSWVDFYDQSHKSSALPLVVQISRAFDELAKQRGKHPLILVMPTATHLRLQMKEGRNPAAPLLENLRKEGIGFLDLSEELLSRLGDKHYRELFASRGGIPTHYSIYGSEIVATILKEHLAGLPLLSGGKEAPDAQVGNTYPRENSSDTRRP